MWVGLGSPLHEFAVHFQMMEGRGCDNIVDTFQIYSVCHLGFHTLFWLSFFGVDSAMCTILKV